MASTFITAKGTEVKVTISKEQRVSQIAGWRFEGSRKRMVTPGRLELPTRSLGNCCSIHLSYGATFRMNILQLIGNDLPHSPSRQVKSTQSL